MRKRATVSTRSKRAEHDHCEWRNDHHAGYCREAGAHPFRHPRGYLGILFVCAGHALDALAEGKELSIGNGAGRRRLAVIDQTDGAPGPRGGARPRRSTMNVYEIITDRICERLEAGVVPWRKPWTARGLDGMPRNLVTRRPYRGVNVWTLAMMGYGSPDWLTYRQATALGGHVRQGEKGSPVIFWKWLDAPARADEQADDGADAADEIRPGRRAPMLRFRTSALRPEVRLQLQSLTMLYRSKTERVLWPVMLMATRSGTPARTWPARAVIGLRQIAPREALGRERVAGVFAREGRREGEPEPDVDCEVEHQEGDEPPGLEEDGRRPPPGREGHCRDAAGLQGAVTASSVRCHGLPIDPTTP